MFLMSWEGQEKGLFSWRRKKEKPRESKRKQFLNCNIRPPFVGAIFEKQMLICLPASGMRSLAGWRAKLIHKVTQKGIFLLFFILGFIWLSKLFIGTQVTIFSVMTFDQLIHLCSQYFSTFWWLLIKSNCWLFLPIFPVQNILLTELAKILFRLRTLIWILL